MKAEQFYLTGHAACEPFLYRGCGLDGIYLLNGYAIYEHDDEQHVSITDMDGLHKAIGRHLVAYKKGLSTKEIKFLRNTMGLTQAELAARLGNTSQSVARWEKGECEIPGTAEKLLRAVFMASLMRNDDLLALKELLVNKLTELDELDDPHSVSAQFELFDQWEDKAVA